MTKKENKPIFPRRFKYGLGFAAAGVLSAVLGTVQKVSIENTYWPQIESCKSYIEPVNKARREAQDLAYRMFDEQELDDDFGLKLAEYRELASKPEYKEAVEELQTLMENKEEEGKFPLMITFVLGFPVALAGMIVGMSSLSAETTSKNNEKSPGENQPEESCCCKRKKEEEEKE